MSRTIWIILVVVVIAFIGGLVFLFAPRGAITPQAVPAAPVVGAHATPQEEVFHGCPGPGDGTDPELNMLKNRVDTAAWQPTTAIQLLNLKWPKGVENRHMNAWQPADRAQVAQPNGLPVQVEGYLLLVRQEGPESPNCHSTEDLDFHMWFADQATDPRATKSVVVEVTPRIRAKHPGWTLGEFQRLAREKPKVRISGWTMLDPEHPEEVGKSRGTIWEIHPVMKVEESQPGGDWREL